MALLRGRVDLRPVPNTSVIEIRSYSEKPDEAAKVANAIAEAYRDHWNHADLAASVFSGPRVENLDHAAPDFRPVRPNKPLNITLGVLMFLTAIPGLLRIFSTVLLIENVVRMLMAAVVVILLLLPSARKSYLPVKETL